MAQNISIQIGEYFENFIKVQIETGRYTSVNEVITTELRDLETNENKKKLLIKELEIGEKSNKIKNFDRVKNLEQLNANF